MLKRLEIGNFRSIRSASLEPSSTGLTVLIGANGTGKSNLIRCLEFLGSIPRHGLEQTFRLYGGADAILPKAIPMSKVRGSEIRFSYSLELPLSKEHPNARTTTLSHELRLAVRSSRVAEVSFERLEFTDPLLAQQQMRSPPVQIAPSNSRVEIIRDERGVRVVTDPPLNSEYLAAFLDWFGLSFLRDTFAGSPPAVMEGTLGALLANAPDPEQPGRLASRPPLSSLLDAAFPSFFAFSFPARAFSAWMGGIRRFDLQLANLRRQQDIVAQPTLSTDGRGLPAAVRDAKGGKNKVSWRRIAETLSELAPHVVDTNVSQLKSGQEFVQFFESKTGRSVESWHASDGTLRALAILLAVETHSGEGMLLIEEPEQGLHPWAVRTLITHIRESAVRRRLQVILTTHSEHVLDNVEPSEVVIATRGQELGTQFSTIRDVAPAHSIEVGELGRMWVSGLLGGVPRVL